MYWCVHMWRHRGESPDALLQSLQQVLARKAWAQPPVPMGPPAPGQPRIDVGLPPPASSGSQLRAQDVGVAGILRRQEVAQQTRGRNMEEAFTDLRALMDKAKEMLAFAERIRDSMMRESQADDAASTEELEVRHALLIFGSECRIDALLHVAVVHAEPGHHQPGYT